MTQALNMALLGNNVNTSGQVSLTAGVSGTLPVANGGTGASTLTANNVLLGNGTSAPLTVAPGTSGNVLTSNGTTWASAAPTGIAFTGAAWATYPSTINSAPTNTALTYSGTAGSFTFTVPAGVSRVMVTCIGGGGGGGNSTSAAGGTGGGGGGYAMAYVTGLTPGQTISVTVGIGGAAVTAGGSSSFGTFCTATGGGAGQTNQTTGTGGTGGSGTVGNFLFSGANGNPCFSATVGCTTQFLASGGGGAVQAAVSSISAFGSGAFAAQASAGPWGQAGAPIIANANTNGNAGNGYGSGGGGSRSSTSTARTGGAGATGLVLIEW